MKKPKARKGTSKFWLDRVRLDKGEAMKPKGRSRVTDKERLDWIARELWNGEDELLDDCYIHGGGKSLRRAIDCAIRASREER